MKRVAVLVSGGGTNLQALLESERRGENPDGKITLVIASKPGVYALERAANWGRGSSVTGEEGSPLSPDTVVLSQNIADALHVTNGDVVILQLKLE